MRILIFHFYVIILAFQEGFYIVTNLVLLVVKNIHLSFLLCSYAFNFFFMLWFSDGVDSYISLPCFFSICAFTRLIIYFNLRFKNMFCKITSSVLYQSISVIKILLQIFLLLNFVSVCCNLISVKVVMIQCSETLV